MEVLIINLQHREYELPLKIEVKIGILCSEIKQRATEVPSDNHLLAY